MGHVDICFLPKPLSCGVEQIRGVLSQEWCYRDGLNYHVIQLRRFFGLLGDHLFSLLEFVQQNRAHPERFYSCCELLFLRVLGLAVLGINSIYVHGVLPLGAWH